VRIKTMQQQRRIAASFPRLSTYTRRLTLDHVWVLTVLALISLFLSVLPLPPNDLWWHMAAGRAMVGQGALLRTNVWAYTLPANAPYVYQSWLSEILLYWIWQIGNVPLLVLTRTLVITLSYGLVTWHAWRRAGQGKAVALALLIAVMIGWGNWTLRPQTLALLPGAAFAVVLGEYLIGRAAARGLLAQPAVMVTWVNMHGSFVLGAGLLGAAWVGTAITVFRGPWALTAAARQRLRALTLAGIATLAGVLVNPLGVGIVGYVRDMLSNGALQKWFVEWQPPRNDLNIMGIGFWFFTLLLLLAVLMAAGPRRPTATDLLWYCGLSWLGFGAIRYAMWYGLLLMPLLAEQLAPWFKNRALASSNPTFSFAYGLLIGGALVAALPWFSPARYLGPGGATLFDSSGPYPLMLSNMTPVAATEWLAQHPIEGRFWTEMSYSSYTIWRLPEKQVFADLRVELFPEQIWQDYFFVVRGDEHGLDVLNTWRISHLLVSTRGQQALRTRLLSTPGWCERYNDGSAAILARCQ